MNIYFVHKLNHMIVVHHKRKHNLVYNHLILMYDIHYLHHMDLDAHDDKGVSQRSPVQEPRQVHLYVDGLV